MSKNYKHSKQDKKQLEKTVGKALDRMTKAKKLAHYDTMTKEQKMNFDKLAKTCNVTESKQETEAITEKRIIKSDGTPIVTVNEDDDGNLVLTPEDMAQKDSILSLQAKALQAKIDKKAIDDQLKEAVHAITGSPALSKLKQDIEARLKAQEDITSNALTVYQAEKDKLNDIQSEYQALTGITKKTKASNGKSKTSGNGNGKFDTAPIKIDNDGSLKVLVTHKDTKSLFEYSLYPDNGHINHDDWLKLRHSLTAQFEKDTQESNLTIRAYLSNLMTKIQEIKAIAPKA